MPVPNAEQYYLSSFKFDDLPLSDDHTALASIRMFIDSGFVERFKIDTKVQHDPVTCVLT